MAGPGTLPQNPDDARTRIAALAAAARALLRSMDSVLASNQEGVWRHTGYKHYMRKHNQLAQKAAELLPLDIPVEIFDENLHRGVHDTTAFAQSAYFQSVHGELSMLCAWLEQNAGTAKQQASSLATFLETKLRRAVFEKPEREKKYKILSSSF